MSEVFAVFLRLGLTSFGGPVAHLAVFRRVFVEQHGWLSEASYPIYLYHFFPIFLIQRLPGGSGRDVVAFVVTLAVSVAGVLAIRRLLGPRARLLFG